MTPLSRCPVMWILLLDMAEFELLDSHLYPPAFILISDKADKPPALFHEDQAKTKIKTATVIFAFGDQGGQQHSQSSCCFKGTDVDSLQLRAYERPLDILGKIFTMDGVGASFYCYES
jgi:hypothetical protein